MDILSHKTQLTKAAVVILLVGFMVIAMYLFTRQNLTGGIVFLLAPFILIFVASVFMDARLALATVFIINYFALGLVRYIPAPWGLSVTGCCYLHGYHCFLKHSTQKFPWAKHATT
jgi:hypothetical protein